MKKDKFYIFKANSSKKEYPNAKAVEIKFDLSI